VVFARGRFISLVALLTSAVLAGASHATPLPSSGGSPFTWAPSAGASAYRFQLRRGTELVYQRVVDAPRLTLPHSWRFDGKSQTLRSGRYLWTVWRLPTHVGAKAIVNARLRVA
jgi:hypothetical protein